MAGEDVGAPPDHLWVHQEGIYRDEYQRTWVAVVEEPTTTSNQSVRLLSKNCVSVVLDIPREDLSSVQDLKKKKTLY
ncbi:Protein p13 MTCP-1 [Sciurus carolinensis]|uniref:Protein p13 MTCP-1 n=1 Tax=Sciurus carolinensis TaxID=30640 RepID=A0AA41T2J4_SCICA|nr:Protein p13 MTCP-1 [Sciurus carolinensis]